MQTKKRKPHHLTWARVRFHIKGPVKGNGSEYLNGDAEYQVLRQKNLGGKRSIYTMCFPKCPSLQDFVAIIKMLVYSSYYTTSYTTTCGTFIDRFTIRKKKVSFFSILIIKLGGFCFYTNCSPAHFALFTQQMSFRLSPCWLEKSLPARFPSKGVVPQRTARAQR